MMKATSEGPGWKQAAAAMLCLAVVLGFLFRDSFQADQVLFSNDAPLGLISSRAGVEASTFEGIVSGFWQDLNWIGIEMPSVLPGLSWGMFQLFGGPVANAKFHVPLSFFFLGFSAWFLFRTLGFKPAVCAIGALAAALNMNPFSHGAWGLPSRALTWGAALLAIAALHSGLKGRAWIKAALAGMCVGLGIVEGFDVGALYSLYVAAFALFLAIAIPSEAPSPASPAKRFGRGVALVAVVAISAGLFSAQALSTLIGTQIKGIAGMGQEDKTREARWDEATAWSLPKAETLRVVVPGLFGYRMDTPEGGAYWGSVGFPAYQRHSGAGEYAGILVVLVAVFGVANAFRKKGNLYTESERRIVLFWAAAAAISILFAWGRWAPFYQVIYRLPFFSTIRNPIKFMHFFHLSLLILFGYGLQLIFRHYISVAAEKTAGPIEQFKRWWARASAFEHKVAYGFGASLGASLIAFLIYSTSKGDLARHLTTVGFPEAEAAKVAAFSLGEVGTFILVFTMALAVLFLCLSGFLSGGRARWAALGLGAFVALDLGFANQPWIIYYNYKEKYVSNGVVDFLKEKTSEHRATMKIAPFSSAFLLSQQANFMQGVFSEWLQHHFQYYNIPTLDIIQMPRTPELDARYRDEFVPRNEDFYKCARLWQLSSTRYILGQKEFLGELNNRFDPLQKRFQIATNFDLTPKPGVAANGNLGLADVTWDLRPNGAFSIFEFTGALPRYHLYSQWRKAADDNSSLTNLSHYLFDATQLVLVNEPEIPASSGGTNIAGTVKIVSYSPKKIVLQTDAAAPSILLCNDRWSANWKAFVDGQPVPLLRCNFLMRGVQTPAGSHQVEMRYEQPARMLWVSFATLAAGALILAFLALDGRKAK